MFSNKLSHYPQNFTTTLQNPKRQHITKQRMFKTKNLPQLCNFTRAALATLMTFSMSVHCSILTVLHCTCTSLHPLHPTSPLALNYTPCMSLLSLHPITPLAPDYTPCIPCTPIPPPPFPIFVSPKKGHNLVCNFFFLINLVCQQILSPKKMLDNLVFKHTFLVGRFLGSNIFCQKKV